MATRTVLDRFMSNYGIAMSMGMLGSMFWHHLHKYQFHRIYHELEEEYRQNGKPKNIKREMITKWSEMRGQEIKKHFKYAAYFAGAATILAVLTRIARRTTNHLPFKPTLPSVGDAALAFVTGTIIFDGPYYMFHQWEESLVKSWKEEEARKAAFSPTTIHITDGGVSTKTNNMML